MRIFSIAILVLFIVCSCGEKLIQEPDNLIPEDKMVQILKDMAIVNAAKSTNMGILKDNDVEPTSYVFEKYEIDSLQFVESDRYYASLPLKYEAIFTEVEAQLEEKKTYLDEQKKINDSLKLLESKRKKNAVLDSINATTTSKENVPQ